MTAEIPPMPASTRRNPLSGSSLWVVITTALVTWIVSTFILSHQHNAKILKPVLVRGHAPVIVIPNKPSTSVAANKSSTKSNEKHEQKQDVEVVGRQGGHFKKKLHTYINMTNYEGPSTTWKVYPHPFPCIDSQGEGHMLVTPAHEGLLLQRPVKTGSTTLSAIILRLVERYAPQHFTGRCKYRAMHATSRDLDFGNRLKGKQSYLLSVVRDPTLKAISRYFHFDVTVGQQAPTDQHFTSIMKRTYNQNNLVHDLMTAKQNSIAASLEKTTVVQQILDDYDFIAVTERMDESLVVWKLLLNLDFYDILYIKARSSGTFSNGDASKGRPCVYLVPSFLTPGMQEFFESKEWKDSNAMDTLLYQAAYQSLDNTVEALGKERVQEELILFHEAQALASDFCQGKIRGFCSAGGTLIPPGKRTCVIWGEGCDFECLDNFQKQEGLKQLLLN